jgi:transcription elongation GreA/GreB family factor
MPIAAASAGSRRSRALLRAEVGDEVALRTPQGVEAIEVLAIDYVEIGD